MGLLQLPWWGLVLVTLALTHLTIVSVTLYLHRSQAHRGVDFHSLVSHAMRFWLWLTTGMVTKEWVAVHRKHHAKVETEEDPHSPHILGIQTVMARGAELYGEESRNTETLDHYGRGTPDDWLERNLYARHSQLGIGIMFVINLILFGPIGITIWAVQMIWIPFWAAGVINGLGHYKGYRNFETEDGSTNLVNIAILIGGEELHNNHHAFPSSARFSMRPWEFDIGWVYLKLLSALGLADIRRVAPRVQVNEGKSMVDLDTVKAVVSTKLDVLASYARTVINPVLREELVDADQGSRKTLMQARPAFFKHEAWIDSSARIRLENALSLNDRLNTVYAFREKLQAVWTTTYSSQEQLVKALQEWCHQAEQTGIQYLQEFARRLQGYTLRAV